MLEIEQPSTSGPARCVVHECEIVFHVGYPKTGTNWLRDSVIADPASGFAVPWDDPAGIAVDAFFRPDGYQEDPARTRALFEEGLRRVAGSRRVPIVSQECLLGNPITREYLGRPVADRIQAAFPRARILIGIREQRALAISSYREYVFQSGCLPIQVYVGTGDEASGFAPFLVPEYLEYDRAVAHYQGLFGRENVLVLPLEQLRRDPRGYLRSLLAFCGCTAAAMDESGPARHVGTKGLALELRRRLNPLAPASPAAPPHRSRAWRIVDRLTRAVDRFTPARWSAGLERRWQAVVARRYEGRFAESNRRLAELTGIDLAALGYELGAGGREAFSVSVSHAQIESSSSSA